MAVIAGYEQFGGSSGTWSLSPSGGGIGIVGHEYTRNFIIVTDNATTREVAVISNEYIPVLGSPWVCGIGDEREFDNFSMATKINATRDGESLKWLVTVSYETYNPDYFNIDPLQNKPKVTWDWDEYEEIVNEDRNGDAVLNTAYDYFDPPVTRLRVRPLLKVNRIEKYFDRQLAQSLISTTNEDTFCNSDPETVLVMNITADDFYDPTNGMKLWNVHYQFAFNENTWAKRILNQGFRQLDDSGNRTNILIDGSPATSPVLLDDDGLAIPAGPDAPANAIELEFDIYNTVNFASNFDMSTIDFGQPPGG